MTKFKRYLLVHLAKSLAVSLTVAFAGFALAEADVIEWDVVLSAVSLGVAAFTAYWAARFKAIKAALEKIKVPTADDVVEDLFDSDDMGS